MERSEHVERVPWRNDRLSFWFCLAPPFLLAVVFWIDPVFQSARWLDGTAMVLLAASLIGFYLALGETLVRFLYARWRYLLVWLGLLVLDASPFVLLLTLVGE